MTLRVAVIGVGSMGRNHARVCWEMSDSVKFVGVSDVDLNQAETIAQKYGVRAYSDYRKLLDELKPDVVTIAVPTSLHKEVALEAISRGIHLLIEKPIASSVEDGEEIIAAAHSKNVKLMIGHIERFNPAVIALKARIEAGELGKVFQVDVRRQGPFPTRINDVGVVVDLAVHDLDIMRYVTGQEIIRVFAETEHQIHSSREDLLTALVRMSSGAVGNLNINWLTPTKIRELCVLGEKGMFVVSYLTQDLSFYKNAKASPGEWDTLSILRGVSEGEMIRFVISKKEPLRAEQEAFLASVRGEIPVPVTGEDGLRALKLAQAIILSGEMNQSITL